jgi:hypothetical protein
MYVLARKAWAGLRKEATAATVCKACKVHKEDTRSGKLLAHEVYEIDYTNHVAKLVEVVGLCKTCFNFAHLGKLLVAETSQGYLEYVLRHGVEALAKENIAPTSLQATYYLIYVRKMSVKDAVAYVREKGLVRLHFDLESWDEWVLSIGDTTYQGITSSDWSEAYG